eukprot:jgi/Chlat1/3818/Chrsp26S03971
MAFDTATAAFKSNPALVGLAVVLCAPVALLFLPAIVIGLGAALVATATWRTLYPVATEAISIVGSKDKFLEESGIDGRSNSAELPTSTQPSTVDGPADGYSTAWPAATAQLIARRQGRASDSTPASPPSGSAEVVKARVVPAPALVSEQTANGNDVQQPASFANIGDSTEVLVVYGSQTGTAGDIARNIAAEVSKHVSGATAKVYAMNECDTASLPNARLLVVVASSTGDGDPPENCTKWYNYIRRQTLPGDHLQNVQYTVLGLGDSNYTKFMHIPRVFKKRLEALGATCFYPCQEADEVEGLEDIVDKWIQELWPALHKAVQSAGKSLANEQSATTLQTPPLSPKKKKTPPVTPVRPVTETSLQDVPLEGVPALPPCRVQVRYHEGYESSQKALAICDAKAGAADASSEDSQRLFSAVVSSSRYLTSAASDRKILHVELDISGSGLKYVPGDSIAVLPVNDTKLVDLLLKRLDLDGRALFSVEAADGSKEALLPHLHTPCRQVASAGMHTRTALLVLGPYVRHAFLHHLDITSIPRKSLLRILAEHCRDEADKRKLLYLCSRSGRDQYKVSIQEHQPGLLDALNFVPSCHPPLDCLLDSLPALVPRMYSVTTSPLVEPNAVHAALTIVDYVTPGKYHKLGVCSNFLDSITAPARLGTSKRSVRVPIMWRSGGDFTLPADLSIPIVMIGPGTGVAPFRGFLQHRRCLVPEGTHGDVGQTWLFFGNRREDEFLYREELEGFARDGTLTKLVTAWSRETDKKVYVQDRMLEYGAELCDLIVQQQAFVFVCGDGAKMAKDVHSTVSSILEQHGGMDSQAASNYLVDMTKSKRYIRDIWS